jgi:hypothetical protein
VKTARLSIAKAILGSTSLPAALALAGAGFLLAGCAALPRPIEAGPVSNPPGPSAAAAPSAVRCLRKIDAFFASSSYAARYGGSIMITSGTPSMEPLIHGQVYIVVMKQPFASINARDLLVYMGRPDESKPDRICMLHRATRREPRGWIMRGDNNPSDESWEPVTPESYIGTVAAIFTFPADS